MLGLCVAVIGIASATPLFFAVTSEYLSRAAAAGGIALISSLGNLGAAVSPSVTGAINSATGTPTYSMVLVRALYLMSGALLLWTVKSAAAAQPKVALADSA
jgi:nitrate/nitrite transporter NarK